MAGYDITLDGPPASYMIGVSAIFLAMLLFPIIFRFLILRRPFLSLWTLAPYSIIYGFFLSVMLHVWLRALYGEIDFHPYFSNGSVLVCAANVYVVSKLGYLKYIVKKQCEDENESITSKN